MKAILFTTWLAIVLASLMVFTVFDTKGAITENHDSLNDHDENLKKAAMQILELKCNVCHKKQNPFMVFKEKNMAKRAKKINQMVFIERRMPKGNEIKLTASEYDKLKEWLNTQKI
ncbi:MAG: hypothetical protein RIC95_13380 [Vicingaceae bacterium]